MENKSPPLLDVEVVPEKSIIIGNLEVFLGLPFQQVVNIIKSFDDVKGVQVWFDDRSPLTADLVIVLSNNGIRFVFDSNTQRLKSIEIVRPECLCLKYLGKPFQSAEQTATSQKLTQVFGWSQPLQAVGSSPGGKYLLKYRGLTFTLADSPTAPNLFIGETPTQDARSLCGVSIYSGDKPDTADVPPIPLSCYYGNVYLESVELERADDRLQWLRVSYSYQGRDAQKRAEHVRCVADVRLAFGMTPQDVQSLLGAPSRTFFKSYDKMKIHLPKDADATTALDELSSAATDYFFNYFTLGIDILFDGVTNRVKKFVLHTNFPGHFDFPVYYRCSFVANLALHSGPFQLRWSTKFSELCKAIPGLADQMKIELTRNCRVSSAFTIPVSYCYCYQDMIFEALYSDHIGSVTIFQLPATDS